MVQMARLLRTWFGIEAVILLLLLLYPTLRIGQAIYGGTLQALLRPEKVIVYFAMISGAAVTGTAWWRLQRGQASGRAWAMAACVLNLPLFALGTLAGITGLAAFSRKEIVEQMLTTAAAERSGRQPRTPGDGTSRWSDVLSVVGQVILFVAGTAFWKGWGETMGLPAPRKYSWLVLYEFALLLSIACHEAGHAIAGWLAQMSLRQFIVGPFEWSLRAGQWRFHFNPAGLLGHGAAGMVPLHLKNLASRSIFMTLGGPVGSLLIGSLAALLALSAKARPWEPAWDFFAIIATIGFGQFLVNLIPVMPENQYSDGAQIYQLMSRGPWADVHLAFAMVSSTLVTPQRPRDYDIAVLQRAGAFLNRGTKAMLLRMYACFHYLDTGRKAEAIGALRSAEAIYPEIAAALTADQHAEFVFVNALYKRDRGRARYWWDQMQAKGDSKFRTDYWRARAAVYWIEGNQEEADDSWKKGNAIARSLPRTGAYDFDRWCFEELRRAMEGDLPATGTAEQEGDLSRPVAGQITGAHLEEPVAAGGEASE